MSSINDTIHAATLTKIDEIKKADLQLHAHAGMTGGTLVALGVAPMKCARGGRNIRIALLISLCVVVSGCAGRYQIVNADFLTDAPKNQCKEPVLLDTWTGKTWTSRRVDGLYNWDRQHKCADPACYKYED